ncbi:MAG: gliding motility-associated C-terminal domain-containing protein [Chitinophagales bacterium]|nr:gliding motility-associated C-terminal domain-containing protein [Chitinophagales bacterium]
MKKTLSLLLLLSVLTQWSSAQPPCNPRGDFSFSRNPCAPLTVTYATTATGFNTIRWFFGDAAVATGNASVTHLYASTGNYQVTLIMDYATCSDTVTKLIALNIQPDNQLIQTNDTLICSGSSKQIKTKAGAQVCWSPVTGLDNPNSPNPVTSVTQTTTYYLHSLTTGANLITNGDFSAGNSGFNSQYLYDPGSGYNPGVYTVTNNLQAWHPAMPACGDHTTGTGNMMAVNGAETPNEKVWTQTIAVQPNTNYMFSTWLQHVTSSNPARLQFSINNVTLGPVFVANNSTCIWDQFYATWNSGNNTTAIISIVNQNIVYSGNDFTLDDIVFAPLHYSTDSVKITVEKPAIISSADQSVCIGKSVQLNTAGGLSYIWTPANGLSNTGIPNPVATPLATTEYIVSGTTANNCTGKDTVLVTVNPLPVVSIIPDTSVCESGSIQLFAGGGTGYTWSPATTLSNSTIANPVASPQSDTRYTVSVTSADGCINSDSVNVTVRTTNGFFIDPAPEICEKSSILLNAGGGNRYSWTPAGTVNDPTASSPTATPLSTTLYTVLITDTVCNSSKSLNTLVTVNNLPAITVSKSNDIDCVNGSSQLQVAGGNYQYQWTPSTGLSSAIIANPLATPADTTIYTVTATDSKGCVNTEAITVNVSYTGKMLYLMPTAFTPNGDGKNDCYGIKYWGPVQELDFSIYNRWGERVFHTNNPNACWNGLYKGARQDAGVFVYVVKAKTLCGDAFKKGTFALIR